MPALRTVVSTVALNSAQAVSVSLQIVKTLGSGGLGGFPIKARERLSCCELPPALNVAKSAHLRHEGKMSSFPGGPGGPCVPLIPLVPLIPGGPCVPCNSWWALCL